MTPEEIAAELTTIMRTPTGTMTLRPLQGLILLGADEAKGVFSNASVGLGKSLAFAILLALIGGDRPLILTESSNIPQMKRDFELYRLHWQMPSMYRLEAYETLSNRPELLDELKPTFLGLDEAHKVKAVKVSARARRVDRWRVENPTVPVAALSGSPGAAFEDYAHLMVWAVPALSSANGGPIPVDDTGRPGGPKFRKLCKDLREDAAFAGKFFAQLRNTPGVVISAETYTDTPLHIKHTVLPTSPEMEPHWRRLRETGTAPDDWLLEGPAEQWIVARCFANDMYYEHIPRPPKSWSEPRKEWIKFCRGLIEDEHAPGGPWDTEGQIAKGVLAGVLPRFQYNAWMAVRDQYTPTIRPAWLGSAAIEYAVEWGRRTAALSGPRSGGCIIWVAQTAVGEEIARRLGWHYYGDGAKNARGQHVSRASAPGIVCSVNSCGTGKNLQHRYSRNLFMSPHSNNDAAEQNIGRTHRSNQPEPVVHVEYLYGCLEDWMAMMKSEREAATTTEELTSPRKLFLAQHDRTRYPVIDEDDNTPGSTGWAWKKASKAVVVVVPTDE